MNDVATPTEGANYQGPIDDLRERIDKCVAAANAWLKSLGGAEITDEQAAKRLNDHLSHLRALTKEIDAAENTAKTPLRKRIKELTEDYTRLGAPVLTATRMLSPYEQKWLIRQQKAIDATKAAERAEADRLLQELADLAAKAKTVEDYVYAAKVADAAAIATKTADAPAPRAQLRGQYSTRARSIRELWRAEWGLDPDAIVHAFTYYIDEPELGACLLKLANAEAPQAHREGRTIPGFVLVPRESVG